MQDRKKSYRGNCRTVGMALSAALVLAACQDSSGPVNDAEFDAVRARADYAALESVLNAAAVRSFEATSSRISATTSGGVSVLPLADGISALATPSTRRTGAERLLRDAGAIAAGLPLISPFNRGATFVWDAARGDYAKSTRSGAPGNGVRFILYATDGATGKPDPARERGYADLVDTGSPTGPDIALRLVAVYEGITFLDYGLTLVARTGGGRLEVTGFVRDAENRVDFDIDVEGARDGASDRVDVTFAIEIEARDFRVVGQVRGVEDGTGRGEVDVTRPPRRRLDPDHRAGRRRPDRCNVLHQRHRIRHGARRSGEPGHSQAGRQRVVRARSRGARAHRAHHRNAAGMARLSGRAGRRTGRTRDPPVNGRGRNRRGRVGGRAGSPPGSFQRSCPEGTADREELEVAFLQLSLLFFPLVVQSSAKAARPGAGSVRRSSASNAARSRRAASVGESPVE